MLFFLKFVFGQMLPWAVGGSWKLRSMTSHNGRMLSPRGGCKHARIWVGCVEMKYGNQIGDDQLP